MQSAFELRMWCEHGLGGAPESHKGSGYAGKRFAVWLKVQCLAGDLVMF
jgi:hypothetical protein